MTDPTPVPDYIDPVHTTVHHIMLIKGFGNPPERKWLGLYGAILITDPNDPRQHLSPEYWYEHYHELSWRTPWLPIRELIHMTNSVSWLPSAIISAYQEDIRQAEQQQQHGQGQDEEQASELGLWQKELGDVNLDPNHGTSDPSRQ